MVPSYNACSKLMVLFDGNRQGGTTDRRAVKDRGHLEPPLLCCSDGGRLIVRLAAERLPRPGPSNLEVEIAPHTGQNQKWGGHHEHNAPAIAAYQIRIVGRFGQALLARWTGHNDSWQTDYQNRNRDDLKKSS